MKRTCTKTDQKGITNVSAQRIIRELSIRMKTLASVLISEIGLQFLRSDKSPFFGKSKATIARPGGGRECTLCEAIVIDLKLDRFTIRMCEQQVQDFIRYVVKTLATFTWITMNLFH